MTDLYRIKTAMQPAYDELAAYDTPEGIALFLNSLGVKGHPGVCNACPIAEYFFMKLRELLPEELALSVNVSAYSVFIFRSSYMGVEFVCTLAMTEFIHAFDCDRFPYLYKEMS